MALRKTAVALPDELLAAIDHAASERGESRNRFVTEVLQRAVRARRDADVTRRLDALFADTDVKEAQNRQAAELDASGTEWSDEGW
jgi:metal-responsive CopG/Arc/MetJ family transcriptional regulator